MNQQENTLSPPAIEETVIDDAQQISKNLESQLAELRLREKSEFLAFRKQWSRYLLMLVIAIVVFNALFLVAVGKKWLQFNDEWLVRVIITGSFVEVLGLAKIVVDFLFKEPPTK
ncbi:hypothetical protein BH09PAT2_BH09PAT2_07380 [soil metagenome]